jgi:hypothetical protein
MFPPDELSLQHRKTTKEKGTDLSDHVHRIGFHFRTHIVEQATTMLEGLQPIDLTGLDIPRTNSGSKPDPIPETQKEINKQADAAIRDLFPRIPNTDREMIVRHAFQKVGEKEFEFASTNSSREPSSMESRWSGYKQI